MGWLSLLLLGASDNEDFTDGVGAKPISWWNFEDAASPANDASANGNALTWPADAAKASPGANGGSYLSLPSGGAASRAFASVSANFPWKAATTAYTIGFWVYAKANLTSFTPLVLLSDGATTGFKFRGGSANGQLGFIGFFTGGSVSLQQDAAGFAVDGWHHLASRWNGTNVAGAGAANEVSLWVDGAKQSTTAIRTGVTLETSHALTFTGSTSGALGYDEAFAFNVPLTDAQIRSIYLHGIAGTR